MEHTSDKKRVAIACQGGGSHTAFTAGVLKGLLRSELEHEIVALSGTSGGAVCALLAWHNLLGGQRGGGGGGSRHLLARQLGHHAVRTGVDLTRKQIAHDVVAWKVRTPAGDGSINRAEGLAEAVFRGSEIESLRLAAAT